MIVALGIDVCSIDRVRRAIERHGAAFAARLLSPRELADRGAGDEATFVAGRFAAKEAFSKAVDGARGVGWHEVEIRRTPGGKPRLDLSGKGLERARQLGADAWHVSVSHDAGVAVAVVVVERRGP